MISPQDGRDNIDDWFFLENQKKKNVNSPEAPSNGHHDDDDDTVRKRTKDFIATELHAMSTLSLYDDSADKAPGEADKWVIAITLLKYIFCE